MAARFVYIRHGHYDKRGVSPRDRDRLPLSDKGRDAAEQAGAWLARQGIAPDRVIATKTQRTQETAEIVLRSLESPLPVTVKPHGFSFSSFDKKLSEWFAGSFVGGVPETVVFVGHHTQQDVMETMEKMDIPTDSRGCVIVCERDTDGSWVVLDYHKGIA